MTVPSEAEALEQVATRARETGRTHWIGRVVEGDAVGRVLERRLECYAAADRSDRFVFESGSGELVLALGLADEIESAGVDRFADVRSWAEDVCARLAWVGAPRSASTPTLLGGFGFEDESRGGEEWKGFPAARFVLPQVVVSRCDGEARAAFVARVEPGATASSIEVQLDTRASWLERLLCEPEVVPRPAVDLDAPWSDGPEFRVRADRPHDVFCGQVDDALEAIGEGELEKTVLARSLSVTHDGSIDVPAFLERLRALYPTCTLVAMGRGDDTFLAATPELLVRVRGDRVSTAALAGSALRGRRPDEDRALGEALLASTKERAEHAHVVDAIRDVLAERTKDLDVPAEPVLRPLFGIQHLETPIGGTLLEGHTDVLDLVSELHPTPAVGGVPAASARDWIRRVEGLDRGWYAAPIGWLDQQGGGDFRVALRSALIRNGVGESGRSSRSLLFAGAGLVAGSEPEQELVETRIKLRALLAPLTEI